MSDKNEMDYLGEFAGQGYEGLGAEDFIVPFLKILQKGSPVCDEANPNKIPGAKAGTFFNTLTKESYGKEITLIPLREVRLWLEWAPNMGGLKGKHTPGSIPTVGSAFGEEGLRTLSGNSISETMNFICLIAGHIEDGPIVFSVSSTGLRHGSFWNTMIKNTRLPNGKAAPYFACKWTLKIVPNAKNNFTWFHVGTKEKTEITNKNEKGEIQYITKEDFTGVLPSWEQSKMLVQRASFDALEERDVKAIEDKTSTEY